MANRKTVNSRIEDATRYRKAKKRRNQPSQNTAVTRHEDAPSVESRYSHFPRLALHYTLDIIFGGLYLLRWPLSFFIFLWFSMAIFRYLSSKIGTALEPFCDVPFFGPLCPNAELAKLDGRSANPQWADFPGLMNTQTSTFEILLEKSAGGSTLSLDIRKAHMATSDLVSLVKYSNLASRDSLVEVLTSFGGDARETARGLQRLSSKVAGSVDKIMAVNEWAISTISEAQSISVPFLDAINPFRSDSQLTKEMVLRTFTETLSVVEQNIARIIIEAEIDHANLGSLEERLSLIQEIVSREDVTISSAKSELLSDLWTVFGGNRGALRRYNNNLNLLRELGNYRREALALVVVTLQTLEAFSNDLDDIRERVSQPELVGTSIPVEVHLNSIQYGLQRLKDSRVKAQEREDEMKRNALLEGNVGDSSPEQVRIIKQYLY
ncbi:hypothetical protein BDP27DRAFT_1452992 [Rhodocollybia butyracea]|uniref:Uncharacterized protein n=1 Tax=Rhodocollybia butyracea TaxID=206335 RepID=A0A9P5PAL7_9AGAR|nr:hypothetical protein BDP27DRAFT_1452992 [Rhodocollybia butyracea]